MGAIEKIENLIETVSNAAVAIEDNAPTERMMENMRSDNTSKADFIQAFRISGGWRCGVTSPACTEFIRELNAIKGKLMRIQKVMSKGGQGGK